MKLALSLLALFYLNTKLLTAVTPLGFIGDSLTGGFGSSPAITPGDKMIADLNTFAGFTNYSAVVEWHGGSTSGDWVSGSTFLNTAISDFTTANVQYVFVLLGTNDALGGGSSAAFTTNMQSVIAGLKAGGFNTIILNYQPYINPAGTFCNTFPQTPTSCAAANARLLQYEADYATMQAADPTHVFVGDTTAYTYFQAHLSEFQADGVHLTNTGYTDLGQFWANYFETFGNPPYKDGTVLVGDVGATTINLVNVGPQGSTPGTLCASANPCTLSFPVASNQKFKVWLSASSPNYLRERGSELACPAPCSISINTERGRPWYKYEITDSSGNPFSPAKLSSAITAPITPSAALTAPFTVPFFVHGFTDHDVTFSFSLGAVSVSNLRLVAWIFNIRQKEMSVIFNGGAEHNVFTIPISGFVTNGSGTCTVTTPYPHGLVSGAEWQNGFNDILANTDSDKRYNGLQTITVTSSTTYTLPCTLAKLDGGGTGDWNPNPITGQPQAGGQFGKTVSQTTYYIDERSWFGGIDGVHDDFEIAVPVNSGEILASATNTVTFRNKGQQTDGHHGPYVKRWNLVQPDVTCTDFITSGTSATATCPGHGYTTGDTVWFRNAPRERWAFNGQRVLTGTTSNTITFNWGPDQGGTAGVAPFILGNNTYDVPTSNDTIVALQPVAIVARCLIPKSSFVFYDPSTFPSYGGNAATGNTLWHTATLKDSNNYFPNHTSLAHCADCHWTNAGDLKYLAFHPDTIIEAAIRRGLTEQDGKNIAAYVASLPITPPANGRPWAKLYQPCPGLDSGAIGNWLAGCNDDWDETYDQDTRNYYCPGGTPPTYTGCSYTAWTPTNGGINTHEVPSILPFWHWMRFIPVIHPKDSFHFVFGTDFTANTAWTLYQQYLSTMVVNNFTSFSTNGLFYIPPNGLFTPVSANDNSFILLSAGGQAGIYSPSEFLKMQLSHINWFMSRMVELTQIFQTYNFGDQAWNFSTGLSPNARAAAQYTRLALWGGTLFSGAPHKSCGGCQYGYFTFNDIRTGAQWNRDTDILYKTQSVVDAGNRWQTGNFPSDLPYKYGFAGTTSNLRPAMYNHIDPMAWETANELGWNNLVNGGTTQTQVSTNARFPLAFVGTDQFTSEAEKAELVNQVIKQMVYVANSGTYGTADWQNFITLSEGAGCLSHVPTAASFNGRTISGTVCRSDGLAFAIALSNYFSLNSTDRAALITWGNTVFTGGYDFNNAAAKVCSYDGNHPKAINCI